MTKKEDQPKRPKRLAYLGYALIVSHVQRLGQNATSREISAATGVRISTVSMTLKRMAELGALRVGYWQPNISGKGPYVPAYVVADGQKDTPYPEGLIRPARVRNMKRHIRPDLIGFCVCFKELQKGAAQWQIIEAGGGCRNTVKAIIEKMKAMGMVHISDWRRYAENRPYYKVYKIGADKDKDKPALKSEKQRNKERWARAKKIALANPFEVKFDDEVSSKSVFKASKKASIAQHVNAPRSIFEMVPA